MPSLNFQKQFVPDVEDGTKTQSIRLERKRPIKPGDKLHLFTGLRTKACRRLIPYGYEFVPVGNNKPFVTCLSVQEIVMQHSVDAYFDIRLDGIRLRTFIALKLANMDGFNNVPDMFEFFKSNYGLPFKGVLIKW